MVTFDAWVRGTEESWEYIYLSPTHGSMGPLLGQVWGLGLYATTAHSDSKSSSGRPVASTRDGGRIAQCKEITNVSVLLCVTFFERASRIMRLWASKMQQLHTGYHCAHWYRHRVRLSDCRSSREMLEFRVRVSLNPSKMQCLLGPTTDTWCAREASPYILIISTLPPGCARCRQARSDSCSLDPQPFNTHQRLKARAERKYWPASTFDSSTHS
jgi:hypothetical protein